MKLIDKDALVAEIKKEIKNIYAGREYVGIPSWEEREIDGLEKAIEILNTLEVKEVDTWYLQEKEDIYNAVKDWGSYTFACVMKDGSIQKFIGNLDEDCEGHINVHIWGVNDDYDNVDDIVKWIEII